MLVKGNIDVFALVQHSHDLNNVASYAIENDVWFDWNRTSANVKFVAFATHLRG